MPIKKHYKREQKKRHKRTPDRTQSNASMHDCSPDIPQCFNLLVGNVQLFASFLYGFLGSL